MKIAIKPINIGLPPAKGVSITLRTEFEIGENTSRLFWQIFDIEGNQLGHGNIDVDSETHSAWGTNDDVIINFAVKELGLEKL